MNEKKKKATRGEACLHRLKQLNYYVKCGLAPITPFPDTVEALGEAPWQMGQYDVVVLTECTHEEIIRIDNFCRQHSPKTKIIVADAVGVFTRVINDFGDNFEVLDKNGEDL